jgi:PAS domain S-box-containing protein
MQNNRKIIYTLTAIVAGLVLYASSLFSYVLFHSMAELFSIIIAAGIFVIAWNTRKFRPNAFLLFFGLASLFIGFIDLMHTLAYKGMSVFPGSGSNLSTQLWVAGRYMQAVSLFIAPFFLGRRVRVVPVAVVYFIATVLVLLSIYHGLFPVTFIEGKGLTPFKVTSEYIISAILILAIINLRKKHDLVERRVLNLLLWAIGAAIASEMAFTFYKDVYGFFSTLGHYCKIGSFYLIYAAIIRTNLVEPFVLMHDEIDRRKKTETALRETTERLSSVMDSINALIYVADMETYMLLFVNEYGRNIWGEIVGKTCWKTLHEGQSGPCAFCTNARLLNADGMPTGVYVWEFQNTKNGRWFDCRDQAIRWSDGRLVRMEIATDITERKRAEEMLCGTTAEVYDLYNNAPCGYHLLNKDGVFVCINNTELSWLGYDMEDVVGKMKFTDMLSPMGARVYRKHFPQLEEGGYIKDIELEMVRKDGTIMPVLLGATAVKDETGTLVMSRITVSDITDFKKLESQLRQAQKMEAIGQLAGGIAHDFNNIMSAIINYAYLIKNCMNEDDPLRDQIEQIGALSMKASEITRGLLAFSRKNIVNLMPLHINKVLLDTGKMLSKFIGEDIQINFRLSDKNLTIMADSSNIEQVIINLATNARDAMPEGGSLTIETDLVIIDDAYIHMHGFGTRGTYALLSVTDTGIGMDEKTRQRIFEPFFTTKELGKGTGLGLAIIYGIVKQHEGYITVYSEPGTGTTFRVYFPLVNAAVPEVKEIKPSDLTGRAETILVAEDEAAVRNSERIILEKSGYRVIEAVNGDDAIEKYEEYKNNIDLLLLDVIMPKKNGKEAYEEIKKITPGIKVIFTSGYSAEIIDKKGIITDGFYHILKPVSPDKLLSTIKEALQDG